MKQPKLGDFVAVYWKDACSHRDIDGPGGGRLMPALSLGILVTNTQEFLGLAQNRFTHSDGHFTYTEVQCIPRSCVTHIDIGKRVKP